jgi:multiple sugar transport system substrate-binding protein
MFVTGRNRPFTRRSMLGGGSAALTAAILARHGHALAQGLSGSIKVGYEGSKPFLGPYVEAAAQAVMEANPGATIETVASDAPDYLSQIGVQLMMGGAPDVFLLLGIGSGELASGQLVRPLDEYLSTWDGWAQYDEQAKFGVTVQGKTWSLPWGLNVYFLYYRKDLFDAAGLPTEWQPQTRDGIIEAAKAVQASNPDVIPYSLYAGANGEFATAADFLTLILSNGGTLTDSSGKWFIDSCPIEGTLGYYEEAFRTSGVIPQSVLTDVNPLQTMPEALGSGDLAILHEQAMQYGPWLDKDAANAENIGIAHFPGDNGLFDLGDAGDAWYINAKSKNPDLGWAFIEAFNSADTQAALAAEDPHLPARLDARAVESWASLPLSQAMLAAAPGMTLPPPEPQFRKLIGVVQNATGLVATGEATPDQAVQRYSDELTRTMGKMNVISETCP